jgi:nitroreductase
MDFFDLVKTRRSIRKFLDVEVDKSKIEKIIEYGRWAPSGLNNQPWKTICITQKDILAELAKCTSSGKVLLSSKVALAIYLDKKQQYNYVKDIQGIGAFIQNILLGVHAEQLGACWLGEILNKTDKVNEILKIDSSQFELMAVIAIGVPTQEELTQSSERKSIDEIFEFF